MMNKAITDQRNLLKLELLKIPKEIRKMKVVDFLNAGGSMDNLMMSEMEEVEDSSLTVRNALQEIKNQHGMTNARQTAGTSRIKRVTRAAKTPMVNQTEGRLTRGAKKRLMVQQTPAVDVNAMEFKTPALYDPSLMSKFSFKTPLITPKFNLRDPMTTGRRPKRGETLVSLAGSPVIMLPGTNNRSVALAIEEGQSPKLFGSLLDMSPNSLVNQEEHLLKLRNILDSKIQQIAKVGH